MKITADGIVLDVVRGKIAWKFRCPQCGFYTTISDRQFCGDEPIRCGAPLCVWRGHYDLSKMLYAVAAS